MIQDNLIYIVRFTRRDRKPDEEYFYRVYEEACWHLDFFRDDDSGLYEKIEILNANDGTVLERLICYG